MHSYICDCKAPYSITTLLTNALLINLLGAPPFEQAGGVKETLQCIMAGRYTVPAGLSEEANDFMKCLIQLVSNTHSSRLTIVIMTSLESVFSVYYSYVEMILNACFIFCSWC